MKHILILTVFALVVLATASCKKENEVPPRQNGYITNYILPPATFLTDQERSILDAKRSEWDKF